jgi:hypothetical protein
MSSWLSEREQRLVAGAEAVFELVINQFVEF